MAAVGQGFSAAARALGMRETSSRRIRQLEGAIRVALLIRYKRGAMLTDAGRR